MQRAFQPQFQRNPTEQVYLNNRRVVAMLPRLASRYIPRLVYLTTKIDLIIGRDIVCIIRLATGECRHRL